MGKIKEALILGEDIKDHLIEHLGEGEMVRTGVPGKRPYAVEDFDILEFCYDKGIMPNEAREMILNADSTSVRDILNC